MHLLRSFWLSVFALLAASIASGAVSQADSTTTVTLNLTKYSKVEHASAGDYVGVSPGIVTMHVGDHVVFVNGDTRHHTATFIAGSTTFPPEPRWGADQLKPNGSIGAPPGAQATSARAHARAPLRPPSPEPICMAA